jgi:hypothetical protein
MTTHVDITRFCLAEGLGDTRVYLRRPMQFGDQVLASDGSILVCIPGRFGHEEAPSHVRDGARRIEQIIKNTQLTWKPADSIELPPPEPCSACDGSGIVYWVDCDDCCGDGEFLKGRHYYRCKECDGKGYFVAKHASHGARAQPCRICEGSGASIQPVTVGEVRVQRRYLAAIAQLPGAQVAPSHEGTLVFVFDGGGWGALAPLR